MAVRHPSVTRVLSCGVLVTDRRHLLIGHATGTARWDIPKGLTDPGESHEAAARRELAEETGLRAGELESLGVFAYRSGKDLALFAWMVEPMPDVAGLRCRSTFDRAGRAIPELDRFACPAWEAALPMMAASMSAVLVRVARDRSWL